MSTIPDDVRNEVIAAIYQRMDGVQWEQLRDDQRSALYASFVEEPDIGGRLAPYKDEPGIRVWIKDGPAKEYRRALEGVGAYAKYTSRQLTVPQELIEQALGNDWVIDPASVKQKPMRCEASHSQTGGSVMAVWGPETSFKDLYWHASLATLAGQYGQVSIIITKSMVAPLPNTSWRRYCRLATLIGASCHQVTQSVIRKP